jgi:uncharacterized protein (DUF1800 family)
MRLVAGLLLIFSLAPASGAERARIPSDAAATAHALNRLTFGPRPGDVERAQAMGLDRWVDRQLSPRTIPDPAIAGRLSRLTTLSLDSTTLAREFFLPARQARQSSQLSASAETRQMEPVRRTPEMADAARQRRRVFTDLAEAKVLRAVYSERQLEEVLVDFWFNHFNVFARKGQTELYVGAYERDVIRPLVLGRFRDLLGATAKSPAMLVYLDNWQSAAATGAVPVNRPQRPRGLNENYARELLELHTLGVDGGYTQDDIVDVARAFTGWTIGRPTEGGFRFAPAMHDRGTKTVLGHTIKSGGGMDDGEQVLDILARHPSTARHIAFKLAQRFVSDVPPPALVDRAARSFLNSGGELREVVRLVITSPEFFDSSVRLAKVKTPFEFVVSALRAGEAEMQSGLAVIRALADMGMPLYLCQPPTGYDDTAEAWISSGALVSRINFAVALSRGEVRGVDLPTSRGSAAALRLGSAEFQKQ